MSNDTSATEPRAQADEPGPGFAPPAPPAAPVDGPPAGAPQPYPPAPATYGAQPRPVAPEQQGQPHGGGQPGQPYGSGEPAQAGPDGPAGAGFPPAAPVGPGAPQDQHWTPDGLVSTPALPPERVGRGALLALIAIPVGVLLAAIIWKLGFVASISGLVLSAGAAVLYTRGSGGRIKKGIPIIAAVIVVGIVGSFFAAVAVDLYDAFPTLDPELASTYPSRGSFVTTNLFYPPVLSAYTHDLVLFVLFGVLGGFGTILRLVRTNASLQR